MTFSMTKVVNNVDIGMFGKRSISLEMKMQVGKNGWELHCWYAYVIENDGKLSPVGRNIITLEWIKKITNECLDEVKAIDSWKFL